ncbi:MAG: pentapeptide repeat-containing protein, partial [Leptolyngbyaceae cyanobacterium MO_188.B28]|nr:pentapeptide repeat-containing protein [Leptolyngbyaceae cyanobacterium MO_188.B28]
MDYHEALGIVESAVYAAKGRKLTDLELTILEGSWKNLTYDEIATGSNYTANYLKGDVSHKFWKLLSEVLGEQVSKKNFRAALTRSSFRHSIALQTQVGEREGENIPSSAVRSPQLNLTQLSTRSDQFNISIDQSLQPPDSTLQNNGAGTAADVDSNIIQRSHRPSDLEARMRDWFTALGYELMPHECKRENYFELIIHIPQRRGYDRILACGVVGEANLQDFHNLRQAVEQQCADEGWLIADRRISPAARITAKEYNKSQKERKHPEIFCYTFDELLDEEADFTNYFQWLEQEIEHMGISDETYIPLACNKKEGTDSVGRPIFSHYAEAEGWIDGYIDRWLDDPAKKHISLLGEFGTGKTWFVFHYAWTTLQRYQEAKKRGTQRPRLPLLILLRDYTKALNLEHVLAGFFYSKHNIRLTSLVFKQLNRMGKLLLIFDGFDEMASKVDHQKMIDNFWELAKVVEADAKAILTCRTEYFRKAEESRALLNAELTASTCKGACDPPQFEVLGLEKFNHDQIHKVLLSRLQNKSPKTREITLEKIMSNPKLRDLAQRPVMINLILDALPEIEAGKPVDLSRVYLYAVRLKMERDIRAERTFTSLADKLYFLCELSWEMLITDQMRLNYRAFPDRIRNLFGLVVQKEIELDHWRYDMMSQSMLTRNADGDYAPAHRSLLEFFIAYKLAAELGVLAPDFTELAKKQAYLDTSATPKEYTWSAYFQHRVNKKGDAIPIPMLKEFSSESLAYLHNTVGQRKLTKAVLDLLEPMLAPTKTTRERLLNIIKSTRGKSPKEVKYVGGNAVTLLLQADAEALKGKDLSQTVIQGADLTHAILQNTNLSGAYLEDSLAMQTFGSILSVVYSNDFLAIGSSNGEICLLQLKDGQKRWVCEKHDHWVRSITFSPDHQRFASGSDDQTVKIWDTSTGQCLSTLEEHGNCVRSVAFSPDGKLLASGSEDRTIKIWDVQTGKCLRTLNEHNGKVFSVVFHPTDSRHLGQGASPLLASGSEDKTIKLWNVTTGECLNTLKGHDHWIRSLAFNSDGQLLVSGGDDQTVRMWDVRTGKCLNTLEGHDHWVRSVAFSPDGQMIVSGSDDQTVRTWDAETGQCLSILYGHENRVWSVAFSEDSKAIASGSDDQTVRTWDAETGQCLTTVQGHSNWILSVAFSPSGHQLASGSEDTVLRVWDIGNREYRTLIGHTSRIWAVTFSPDGQLLASGSDDQTIRIWDLETGKGKQCLRTLTEHEHWVRSVAFSPDSQLIASGSDDKSIRIWDVHTGKCLTILQGHKHWIRSVAFSPNGQLIASGSDDHTIKLWNVKTGKSVATLAQHNNLVRSVTFSPDGKLLVSGSDDHTVKVWEVQTGECLNTLQEHISWVHSVVFSPDGKLIASGSQDGTTRLWNVGDGKLINFFKKHTDSVLTVAFSPDGKLIASGGQDETIQL